jgi:hypothetical protein
MSNSFESYRLYLDESGDHVFHNEDTLAQASHRYLALVGAWFSQGEAYRLFHDNLAGLKQKHFPHSPDEPPIFHREALIRCRGTFWRLRDEQARRAFDDDLYNLIATSEFLTIGIVIDKLKLKQAYPDPFHPYHLALGLLLERYCGWLNHINRKGDVLVESRGGEEDRQLKNAYEHTWTHGSSYRKANFFRQVLSSKELKLKKKSENLAGLQLADLIAHAIKTDILVGHQCPNVAITPFEQRLLAIVRSKYNRRLSDERIEGYGTILFPK